MSATSVTGTGPGAAEAGVKGPGNGRNFFVPSINPHVIAAGAATMASGTVRVTFPNALAETEANYVVIVTPEATVDTAVFVTKHDTDSLFDYFDIGETAVGSSATVMWIVVKAGFGLEA